MRFQDDHSRAKFLEFRAHLRRHLGLLVFALRASGGGHAIARNITFVTIWRKC